MSEFIDESYLVFIKKEDFITLTMKRNKGKDKSKKKIGFKYFYCDKMGYKKINYFYKYLKKVLSSWKSGKDRA